MDFGRYPKPDGASTLPASHASSSARSKTPVLSFSAFQAQTSRVTTVKRKPLPPSASPVITRPPLSSGGRVIAVGDDDHDHDHDNPATDAQSSFQALSPAHRVAYTPSNASPPLVVRDLDQ